jgi:hypothetical protein
MSVVGQLQMNPEHTENIFVFNLMTFRINVCSLSQKLSDFSIVSKASNGQLLWQREYTWMH